MDNMPRWRYPTGVDEVEEAVEVEVAVADSEVAVEVMVVGEEEAVSVTEATRVAMHVERRVTLPGTAIRAEDLVMGLGEGTPGPDAVHADRLTEAVPGRVLALDHHRENVSTVAARVEALLQLQTRKYELPGISRKEGCSFHLRIHNVLYIG